MLFRSSRAACRTRSLVAAEMDWFGESRSTKLAVARDTPLAAATSFSVTRFGSRILSLPVRVLPRPYRTIRVLAKSIY